MFDVTLGWSVVSPVVQDCSHGTSAHRVVESVGEISHVTGPVIVPRTPGEALGR